MRGLGPDAASVVGTTRVLLFVFFCYSIQLYLLLSPCLCFFSFLYVDLYVLGDDYENFRDLSCERNIYM